MCYLLSDICVLFFKQKTAYEMRISDWSSDVCSSDLDPHPPYRHRARVPLGRVDVEHHRLRQRSDEGGADPLDESEEDHFLQILRRAARHRSDDEKIGRASGRERVCQYV